MNSFGNEPAAAQALASSDPEGDQQARTDAAADRAGELSQPFEFYVAAKRIPDVARARQSIARAFRQMRARGQAKLARVVCRRMKEASGLSVNRFWNLPT